MSPDEHKSDRSPKKAINERRPSSTLKTSRSCSLTCQLGITICFPLLILNVLNRRCTHALEVPCTWSTAPQSWMLAFGITLILVAYLRDFRRDGSQEERRRDPLAARGVALDRAISGDRLQIFAPVVALLNNLSMAVGARMKVEAKDESPHLHPG